MPQIDKPLEELRSYRGINPRPPDFDEFWDEALAELDQVDPELTLSPAAMETSFASCHDLSFTGVGGARIYAKLIVPLKHTGPLPAAVRFHGYTGSSGDWSDHLGLAAEGFVVAALDCRGQGGRSEDLGGAVGNTHHGHIIRGASDDPRKLLFRQIFLDTVQLARIVMDMEQVDEDRVAATGGSQGGGLTIACAALEPRISRAASVFPFLSDYLRVWEMDLAERAYREIREHLRRTDPTHEHMQEFFTRLGYIDVHHLAPRIKADLLVLTGLMDEVCPPSTQFAVFNAVTASKEMIIYPDFGHERLPGADDRVFQFLRAM